MEEFLTLIKETRLLLLSQLQSTYLEKEDSQIIPSSPSVKREKIPVTKIREILPSKKEEKSPPSIAAIDTLPSTPFEEMKQLFKKQFPSLYQDRPSAYIKLLTMDLSVLPFYQKLEGAISESFLPAQAFFSPDESTLKQHLSDPFLKLFLCSFREIEKYFSVSHHQIHELGKFDEKIYWFPLHPCTLYQKDSELKRALWNKLKTLPFADMLP